MVNKKIKKSSMTLTGIVLSLLIVMAIFYAGFSFLSDNASDAGIVIDAKYNQTYTNLQTSQDSLELNVNAIKDNLDNVSEADNTFQVAWNGLKGLGNVLKLPLRFIDNAVSTFDALIISLDVIPPKIKTLIFIGILVTMVLLILAILKGEPRT